MRWQMNLRNDRPALRHTGPITFNKAANQQMSTLKWIRSRLGWFFLLIFLSALPLAGREKDQLSYGEGLIVNIPLPESEVAQVVEDISQNGVIRGTKEYNKDEFVTGAKYAASSRVFPPWDEGGKVFYKVREGAIDPRNFKDGGDVGTLAVRYVVLPQGEKNTVLRINALFKEDFRHTLHQSNGSVESAEYKDIQEHLEAIEVMKQQTAEAQKEREEQLEKKKNLPMLGERLTKMPQTSTSADTQILEGQGSPAPQAVETPAAESTPPSQPVSGQTLEEHLKDLRRQVERRVKAPGAPLKSAPFHTASTLQPLTAGTEVLILVSTPYWYGVETHEGQHGWMLRDQLEQP